MSQVERKISIDRDALLSSNEWLVTNGLGGYSSTSLGGAVTRKYHGLLVAALPAPYGRTNMLNFVADRLMKGEKEISLSHLERVDRELNLHNFYLKEFRLENGLPVWEYVIEDLVLEKRLLLVHLQNTVHIQYRILKYFGDEKLQIKWQPFFHFRGHEDDVGLAHREEDYAVRSVDDHYEILHERYPPLCVMVSSALPKHLVLHKETIPDIFFEIELRRGYESVGSVHSPAYFDAEITQGHPVTFIVSTEQWEMIMAMNPVEAIEGEKKRRLNLIELAEKYPPLMPIKTELTLAADQFVIVPYTRLNDLIRFHAEGEEIRSIIAGYHWFTDWGRDTMISLEGLTLVTGRWKEAESILKTFSFYIRDGLIPNMFPEGKNEGVYHTVDATLWYFQAIARYYAYTHQKEILHTLVPKLIDIVDWHLKGTAFGIKVDTDGLLTQGAEGYQLTWMDAKVADWVVTPRRGKAVEINALWYNALMLLKEFIQEIDYPANTDQLTYYADLCYQSFNKRFWYEKEGYLYDVIDTPTKQDDSACRPNQLFAISLTHPILDPLRWPTVLQVVQHRLLTSVGLRTLDESNPEYKQRYDGDLRARDAAYHQGTVWPWLIGPFIDAWLKTYPEKIEEAKIILRGLESHLNEFGFGTLCEIFDAEEPYHARGCISQAWSVAEYLRALQVVYSK